MGCERGICFRGESECRAKASDPHRRSKGDFSRENGEKESVLAKGAIPGVERKLIGKIKTNGQGGRA